MTAKKSYTATTSTLRIAFQVKCQVWNVIVVKCVFQKQWVTTYTSNWVEKDTHKKFYFFSLVIYMKWICLKRHDKGKSKQTSKEKSLQRWTESHKSVYNVPWHILTLSLVQILSKQMNQIHILHFWATSLLDEKVLHKMWELPCDWKFIPLQSASVELQRLKVEHCWTLNVQAEFYEQICAFHVTDDYLQTSCCFLSGYEYYSIEKVIHSPIPV